MSQKQLPPKVQIQVVAPQGKPAKAVRRRAPSRLAWFASRLLVLLVLLVLLAYFLPSIVASRTVWKKLLAWVSPELAQQVDAKSLNIGWFSPLEISEAVVLDPAGQPLAKVSQIKSQKTLLSMALAYPHLGTIEVVD